MIPRTAPVTAMLTCILACQHKAASTPSFAPPPGTETTATAPRGAPSRPVAYPRVEIHFTDHTADEGAWSTTVLRADGAFESEHEMSDGGATSTITRCSGSIDAAEAETLLSMMHADAIEPTEPPTPGMGEALERGIRGSYRIRYLERATTSAWVDPARWDEARLAPLFERMAEAMTCTKSKR